jgi:hypothetical protein
LPGKVKVGHWVIAKLVLGLVRGLVGAVVKGSCSDLRYKSLAGSSGLSRGLCSAGVLFLILTGV